MLIQKHAEFNIELNAKNSFSWTAFHFACNYGKANIVEMMVENAKFCKLDLTARENTGRTGYQLAKENGKTDVVNLIEEKLLSITF